jgi:GNAT superfamily N-acetyltransferase
MLASPAAGLKHHLSGVIVDKLGSDFPDPPLGEPISDPLWEGQIMAVTGAAGLTIATFAERPDLLREVFDPEIQSAVPEFMRHDAVAALYYGDGRLDLYRDFGLVAVDPTEPDRPVARAFSVPFAFCDGGSGREELPDAGWDAVIRWAHEDSQAGRPATAVSALEIMVAPRLQRSGISRMMLTALRDNARRLGFADLYAPLRPTDKHREPLTPFADYVARLREDGLPYDSWVRTHVRAGARIVKVAPCSMVIAGTIAEWSQWTGFRFAASGPAIVPGALSPIHVSFDQDHAVYVEPNLWVHHRVD